MNPLQTPTAAGPVLRGEVGRPGDTSYDELCRVPNAMIDRRPALITRVAAAAGVAAAIVDAREHGLPIGVRGGGHSGMGVVDGGLVIDLRSLDAITVWERERDARGRRPGVANDRGYFGAIRKAPSSRIVSPLSITFSTM